MRGEYDMETNVLVIGLGLIGGSVSLAIKKDHSCYVEGYDSNLERAKLGENLNVIDKHVTEADLEASVEKADVLIIAVPVNETIKVLHSLKEMNLKEDLLITDVGSTKRNIAETANKTLPSHVQFVGGHPMAGSHKSGIEAARADLFENAFYVITKVENTSTNAVEKWKSLLSGANATFIEMDSVEHDQVAGVISHFPHIIASGLVQHAEHYYKTNPLIKDLAAGGFKDITRIASSNPTMWTDILMHNREPILKQFDLWFNQMAEIRSHLEESNIDQIYDFFAETKRFRDGFSTHKRGALTTYVDLFIDIPDSPGVLASITTMLAENNINITNIEIIESREDIYGVLRLSFLNDESRVQANFLLRDQYKTFIID